MALFKEDPAVAAERAQLKKQQVAERQVQQKEAERKRQEAAFRASLQGQARAAYERGDMLFQFSSDLSNIQGTIATLAAPISPAGAYSRRRDHVPTDVLNAIANEGWDLHSFSTAFIPTTEVSRDKFFSSGQQTAISGQLVGTYVFIRAEDDGESPLAQPRHAGAADPGRQLESPLVAKRDELEEADATAAQAQARAKAARARADELRRQVEESKGPDPDQPTAKRLGRV